MAPELAASVSGGVGAAEGSRAVRGSVGTEISATRSGGGNLLERVPPHDDDAEDAVLGAMLTDRRATGIAVETLIPEDFYSARRQLLFRLFADLYAVQEDLDELVVRSEIERRGLAERIGGIEIVGRLLEQTPNAANIERYCRLVRERAEERELAAGAVSILRLAHGEASEQEQAGTGSLIEKAEEIVYRVGDRRAAPGANNLSSILDTCLAEADRAMGARRAGLPIPSPALRTRYVDFDRMMGGGLWPGELILVAGRPSMGKTTFALNIARQVTHTTRKPGDEPTSTAIFSLEMPKEQLAKNILCAEARVDGEKMRTCAFSEEEYDQVRSAGEMLRQAPLFVNDGGALTPPALRAQCRRLRHREKLGLVVVDYLQLMRSARRSDSREQEVAEISRELKGVARELNIPVIAVSQLNRAPEGRSDKRPQLSDLRESGALEQDADVVILLYREEYYERGEGEVPLEAQNVAEVIIAKNRNGRVGTVKFTFFKEFLRFEAHSPAVPAGGYA